MSTGLNSLQRRRPAKTRLRRRGRLAHPCHRARTQDAARVVNRDEGLADSRPVWDAYLSVFVLIAPVRVLGEKLRVGVLYRVITRIDSAADLAVAIDSDEVLQVPGVVHLVPVTESKPLDRSGGLKNLQSVKNGASTSVVVAVL